MVSSPGSGTPVLHHVTLNCSHPKRELCASGHGGKLVSPSPGTLVLGPRKWRPMRTVQGTQTELIPPQNTNKTAHSAKPMVPRAQLSLFTGLWVEEQCPSPSTETCPPRPWTLGHITLHLRMDSAAVVTSDLEMGGRSSWEIQLGPT